MNFNLASLFDFLNTAEIFYATYLMNLKMNKILGEFLMGLRMQDLILTHFLMCLIVSKELIRLKNLKNLELKIIDFNKRRRPAYNTIYFYSDLDFSFFFL